MITAWAKWKEKGCFTSLAVHSFDVAACLKALLDIAAIRSAIRSHDGTIWDAVLKERLCALAFLHDIGKINAGFQFKIQEAQPAGRAGHVAEAMLLLGHEKLAAFRAALHLPQMAQEWGPAFPHLFLAILAHHGRPVSSDRANQTDSIWQRQGEYDPLEAAREMGGLLRLHFPLAFAEGLQLPEAPEFQHFFAGLVALADQTASRDDLFPLGRRMDAALPARSAQAAREAMALLQLDVAAIRAGRRAPAPAAMFGWPGDTGPTSIQQALRDLPLDRRLVVLEAETGSGKTEAAFLRFRHLFEAGEVDALYFAVPTRAAATGLHGRIDRASRAWLGVEAVLALPGYLKAGQASGQALPGWEVLWDDAPDARLRASRWAAETPRRYLAAAVAVGTVDQAMLAGLPVKWAHFRAATLSRAMLVVDEVHASDIYMREIMADVVRAHVARGGHALLMSATLGAAARAAWLNPGRRSQPARFPEYPAVSWWADGREQHLALPSQGRPKRVAISALADMALPEAVARHALAASRAGAKVLVLRNTVGQAVATQRAIEALDPEASLLRVNGTAAPHHGRFALEDRRLLDAAVEAVFGKNTPMQPAIVAGTQTLEISVDLCADLLITDLCPVDVLLQRLGRLHRHHRERPDGFQEPRCIVLTPEKLAPDAELLRFGLGANRDGGGVYPDIVGLEATRRLIEERPVWDIPADNRALVEAGTDPEALGQLAGRLGEAWVKAREGMTGRDRARGQQGRLQLLQRSVAFNGFDELFPEEERILTRLGGDRVLLALPQGTIGPFGSAISQITLPGHLLKGAKAEDELSVEPGEGEQCLTIRLGEARFGYGRLGLERL